MEVDGRTLGDSVGARRVGSRADVLELGSGPGLTTDVLRGRTARLTAVEIDPRLASLQERMKNTNVEVVEADATAMPFPDGSLAVLSFTMLHHVPSVTLQDRLLAEAWRCCVREAYSRDGHCTGRSLAAGPHRRHRGPGGPRGPQPKAQDGWLR